MMKGRALFLALLLLGASGVAAAAGRVLFVAGDAHLERDGAPERLQKGERVEAGDTLVTGEGGRVQLLMDDGDRMALRPGTRLRIDQFTTPASPQQPGTGIAIYSLIKGGFRALTRSLGKRDEASYRVNTPVATLGIRGTHYTIRICKGDCNATDGLYAGVQDGGISLKNAAGQQNVGENEFAYAAGNNSKPRLLLEPPLPLQDDTGGTKGDGSVDDSFSNRSSPAEGEIELQPGDIPRPDQDIEGTDPSGRPFDFTPGQTPGPPPVIEEPGGGDSAG